jgi:hypothetical protein
MRDRAVLLLITAGAAACDGSLREQFGRSDLDASVLSMIQPPPCDPPATAADRGECAGGGQPGDDCLMCHRTGGTARPYAFAGTLYDAMAIQPFAGATIYVMDSAGAITTSISRGNGNFFADGVVHFPARVFLSLCPDVLEMLGTVGEATGANCNTAGCHTTGLRLHTR